MPELVAFSAELLMRTYHNNPLTVSNTKSLKYICGNFTFEALNLHREKSTLEKIVPQGLIRNTESLLFFHKIHCGTISIDKDKYRLSIRR